MPLGRTDKWDGGQMAHPTIYGLGTFARNNDDREGRAIEEGLANEAFAAFRKTYLDGLRKLVGDEQPGAEAEAEPAPTPTPLAWPQATEVPDATPVSKPLATSEVL